MTENEKTNSQATEQKTSPSSAPLIFISHDSRDIVVALKL